MAEVVITTGKQDACLCRRHAADSLAGNVSLLAQLVIELYAPASD